MLHCLKITKKLHCFKPLLSALAVVILTTALAVSSFATGVEGHINTTFYYWTTQEFFQDLTRYSRVGPDVDLTQWSLGHSVTGQCVVYPFTGIYNDVNGEQAFFTRYFTYTIQYEFHNANLNTWRNPTYNGTPNVVFLREYTDPLTDGIRIQDVLPTDSYSVTVSNSLGNNQTIVNLTINTSAESFPLDSIKYVAPLLYSSSESEFYLQYVGVTGTYDPDGDKFQQALLQQLNIFGQQNHEDLMKIYESINDDSEGNSYDTSVGGAVGDMSSIEDSIFNDINSKSATVELNGQTINLQMDSNALNALQSFVNGYSEGQFNSRAAIYINDVFNEFIPYLAFPVFISLALGVCLLFLEGRRT